MYAKSKTKFVRGRIHYLNLNNILPENLNTNFAFWLTSRRLIEQCSWIRHKCGEHMFCEKVAGGMVQIHKLLCLRVLAR